MASVGVKVDGLMLAIVGVGVLAGVVWFKWGDTIKQTITEDLNPASDKNIANQAVQTVTAPVVQAVTGGESSSIGEMCAGNSSFLLTPVCAPFHFWDMVIPE